MRAKLALVVLWSCAAAAQTGPSFEAASVKPAQKGRGSGSLSGGPGTNSPGQLTGTSTLKALVMRAYELKGYQVAGPAWMETERYDIAAKIPAGAGKKQVSVMLQSLLSERFGLVAHRETKILPIYALVVARNGPKVKKSPADQSTGTAPPKLTRGADGYPEIAPGVEVPRSYEVVVGGSDGILYKLWARRETMQQLADRLSSQLSRPVIDRTELTSQYDFALAWTMDSGVVPRTEPPPDEIEMQSTPVLSGPGLSIFTAIKSQLGLRLEQRKAPLEMLVIDRVEKVPAAN